MLDKLTQERLKQVASYDPDTGVFTWLEWRSRSAPAGSIAGSIKENGYLRITIDGKGYKAHRLAWLYVYGVFPPAMLDHRDGEKANNRIGNLRLATPMESSQNLRKYSTNSSGFTGVKAHRTKWRATLRTKVLGSFDTPEAAYAKYLSARAKAFEFQPVPRA